MYLTPFYFYFNYIAKSHMDYDRTFNRGLQKNFTMQKVTLQSERSLLILNSIAVIRENTGKQNFFQDSALNG